MEIITPIEKHKVKIKDYITGRDVRELRKILIGELGITNVNSEIMENGNIKGNQFIELIDKGIELLVFEVDGSTEKILDKVLDMRSEDYDFIANKVQEIINPIDIDKKKELKTPTGNHFTEVKSK